MRRAAAISHGSAMRLPPWAPYLRDDEERSKPALAVSPDGAALRVHHGPRPPAASLSEPASADVMASRPALFLAVGTRWR